MAKAFYIKLARANLSRNRRMYGPYCVATALMSGIFFIILNLVFSRSVANLSYGEVVVAMFTFGIVVMTLFTVGYVFYLNSFLIKRRKKEFGLYGVLGMERRHVARVILWENAMLSFGSLLLGLLFGIVFGRLAFLLLMNILDTAQGSRFVISGWALVATAGIFSVIFVLTTLYNLNQVRLASPVDLLKGEQKGEKKVRLPLVTTLIGVGMLGFAYYLAITVKTPALALLDFWPAVILVILATWLLFTGGSVFILGRLQKTPGIYYKPRNFIAISGLIHRMKQNAAGLANICILSTMVMVTVACCASLYIGQDVIVREQNPDDISYTLRLEDREEQHALIGETMAQALQMAARDGTVIEDMYAYDFQRVNVMYTDGQFAYADENGNLRVTFEEQASQYISVGVILLEDYNAVTGSAASLGEREILLLSEKDLGRVTSLRAEGGELAVADRIAGTKFTSRKNSEGRDMMIAVVSDMETADRLVRAMNPSMEGALMHTRFVLNLDAADEAGRAFAAELRETFRTRADAMEAREGGVSYRTENIFENRLDGYGLYGGLLFLGVFFAFLFLINTVLIIYFKQISEGFDDAERFTILQKVGLSDDEVRSTINRQMLIIFLLPLVAALIHIAAASNMIRQMLGTFMLTDFALTMGCIIATSAIFVVVYLCVYRITARTYYRLVRW